MAVTPVGPASPGAGAAGVSDVAGQGAGGGAASGPVRPNTAAGDAAPDAGVRRLPAPADSLDIHPLDGAGALRILLAEVQSELSAVGPSGVQRLQGPPDQANAWPAVSPSIEVAAQGMIRLLLRAVGMASPDPAAMPDMAAVPDTERAGRAETGLRAALDRGVDLVASWHDVSAATLQFALDVRALVLRQMVETPPDPAWLDPEWLGLAPAMQDYWRRRRRRRNALVDPDLQPWPDAAVDEEPKDRDGPGGEARTASQ